MRFVIRSREFSAPPSRTPTAQHASLAPLGRIAWIVVRPVLKLLGRRTTEAELSCYWDCRRKAGGFDKAQCLSNCRETTTWLKQIHDWVNRMPPKIIQKK